MYKDKATITTDTILQSVDCPEGLQENNRRLNQPHIIFLDLTRDPIVSIFMYHCNINGYSCLTHHFIYKNPSLPKRKLGS